MATEDASSAVEEAAAGGDGTADGPIDIEWPERSRPPVGRRTLVAVVGLAAVALAFAVDYAAPAGEPLALGYDVKRLQWLWLGCLWVDLVYVGGAVVDDPDRARAFVRELRGRPVAFAATAVVVAILLAGTFAPVFFAQPNPDFLNRNQPPLFVAVSMEVVGNCVNPAGDVCRGSMRFPLGTDNAGKSMLKMTVFGARVVVKLAVVSVTLIVPLATLAGTVAAYAGDRADRVITTVAETLKTVPALLVFLLWRWVADDGSLFALVMAFSLINWGNVAIVVRSRALNEVGKDYVMAAEAGGASKLEVVYDHLVPNVSRTAISAAVYQVPLFVTVEATLSFLRFGSPPSALLTTPPTQESWGRMIGGGLATLNPYWWPVAIPVAALLVTILTLNLTADALQDVLDPG